MSEQLPAIGASATKDDQLKHAVEDKNIENQTESSSGALVPTTQALVPASEALVTTDDVDNNIDEDYSKALVPASEALVTTDGTDENIHEDYSEALVPASDALVTTDGMDRNIDENYNRALVPASEALVTTDGTNDNIDEDYSEALVPVCNKGSGEEALGAAATEENIENEPKAIDNEIKVVESLAGGAAAAPKNVNNGANNVTESPDNIALQNVLANLKRELSRANEELQQQKSIAMLEKSKRVVIEEEWKQDLERMARLNAESDKLSHEVTRLLCSNSDLTNAVAGSKSAIDSSLSDSAPIKFENIRMKTEMGAVSAQSHYLQNELTKAKAELDQCQSKYQFEINSLKSQLAPLQSDLQSMKEALENNLRRAQEIENANSELKSKLESTSQQLRKSLENFNELIKRCEARLATEQQAKEVQKSQNEMLQGGIRTKKEEIEALREAAIAHLAKKKNLRYDEEKTGELNYDIINVREGYKEVYERWRRYSPHPSN